MANTIDSAAGNVFLRASGISKSFGGLSVLNGFDLSLRQGEFVSLVGPSGCGKTTLFKILAGLTTDFSGDLERGEVCGSGLFASVVFQDVAFFPWLNILDNIKICLNDHGSGLEKEQVALRYLHKVKLLDFKDYFPGELSEGMLQRANVARALASRSRLVLMDEPFVHLDFLSRTRLQQMVLEMSESESRAVCFITHNIHEAITLADRVVVMSARPGKNIREFTVDISHPRDVHMIRQDRRYLDLVEDITALVSAEVEKSQQEFDQWIKQNHRIK